MSVVRVAGAALLMLAASAPSWKIVAALGPVFTVYVQPDQVKNKDVYVSVVEYMFKQAGDQRPFQLDFFDSLHDTPTSRHFTASNRLHHRARFNFNPANGMKRFVWIVPEDPNSPGGKRKLIQDDLPLAVADGKTK